MKRKDVLQKIAFMDPATMAVIGGGLHVGTNLAMAKLYKSNVGKKLLGSLTQHGYNQGLKGTKMSPTLERGFTYGLGPESLADYKVGKTTGKFVGRMKSMNPEQRATFSRRVLNKVTSGQSAKYNDWIESAAKSDFKGLPDLKKGPLLDEFKKIPGTSGISAAIEGNTNKKFSKWLGNRKEVLEKSKPSKLTNVVHGVVGAGMAGATAMGVPGVAEGGLHMGVNALRNGISKTQLGKKYLEGVFTKAYNKGEVSKGKIMANKILLSPRAGEISEAGAYLGKKQEMLKQKFISQGEAGPNAIKKIKDFKLFNPKKGLRSAVDSIKNLYSDLKFSQKLDPVTKGNNIVQSSIEQAKK